MKIVMFGIRRSGNSPIRNWLAEKHGLKSRINADIKNLQDNAVNSVEEYPITEQILNDIKADRKIVILRDPYNLAATRIKHYNLMTRSGWIDKEQALWGWKMYAKFFINPPKGVECINYNKFIKEEKPLRVDDNGNGSSFDGTNYDGRANEMPVLDRWKNYKDNPHYINLFTEEIKELSNQIFGRGEWNTLFSPQKAASEKT